jgi:hypothetical protein
MTARRQISLRLVAKPTSGSIIDAPPVLNASDHTIDFVCAKCRELLMYAEEDQVFNVTICCTICGTYNSTNVGPTSMAQYRFTLQNDGERIDDLGGVALADDAEALAFAKRVVRELLDKNPEQYALWTMDVTDGERTVHRIPLM